MRVSLKAREAETVRETERVGEERMRFRESDRQRQT